MRGPPPELGLNHDDQEARLIPKQIRKVLSSMRKHQARALLMGGQDCVFYRAAEFSRDAGFAILSPEMSIRPGTVSPQKPKLLQASFDIFYQARLSRHCFA